jgi:YD repeat-containing protein
MWSLGKAQERSMKRVKDYSSKVRSFSQISKWSLTAMRDRLLLLVLACACLMGEAVVCRPVPSNLFCIGELMAADISYVYDDLGRLKAAIDPASDTAVYSYDAVGNLSSISRQSSSTVSVLEFTPKSGPVGTSVTIFGTAFSTTPSQNTVTFNGVAATVTSSTQTKIVTTVPSGATTGVIGITAPGGSASSSTAFTVTASSGVPTITGFTPTIGTPGTAVTITGTNFDTTPSENDTRFNVGHAIVSTATSTSLSTTVPGGTGSGRISVTTAMGKAVSASDFFIPPSPYAVADVAYTGRMSIGGSSHTASIGTASKIALVTFDGTAGQVIGLGISANTFTNLAGDIKKPDGTTLTSFSAYNSLTLPVTGTYTILLRPSGTGVGSVTFTLSEELDAGTVEINGASKTVTIDRKGQRARVTFTGTAGQLVGVGFNSNTFTNLAGDIKKPDGTTLTSFSAYNSLTLPVTGTYTILLRPTGTGVGSVTFTLSEELDAGTVEINGASKTVTIDRKGQRARVTFTGTASQIVGLGISSNTFTNLAGDVKKPDGSTLASISAFTNATLPVTGTYTILLRPTGTGVGSVALTMTSP